MNLKPHKQVTLEHNGGCVNCFNSLGVQSRMDIYIYLKDHGQSTVGDVVKHIKLTQPTISYHLKEMKDNGLLDSRRIGKEVYYMLSTRCHMYDRDCVLSHVQFPR